MNLEIKQRNSVLYQVFFFILISPLYLLALSSLSSGYSPISLELLLSFLRGKFWIFPLVFFAAWGVWHARSWSSHILSFYVVLMSLIQIFIFWGYLDKLVLFLIFFYLLMALGFSFFWSIELSKVLYHPGFFYLDLGKKSDYPIAVEFMFAQSDVSKNYKGHLSNWDIASCYIVPEDEKISLKGGEEIDLVLTYENIRFYGKGRVITAYGSAFGVLLNNIASPEGTPVWSDFYAIISERGIIHSV